MVYSFEMCIAAWADGGFYFFDADKVVVEGCMACS